MLPNEFSKRWPRAESAIKKRPKDFSRALRIVGAESSDTGKVCELTVRALDEYLYITDVANASYKRSEYRTAMEDVKKHAGLLARTLEGLDTGGESDWNDALFREFPEIDKIAKIDQVAQRPWPIHRVVKRIDAAARLNRKIEKIAVAQLDTMDLYNEQYKLEMAKKKKGKPNDAPIFEAGGRRPSPLWVLAYDTVEIFELVGLQEYLDPDDEFGIWNEFVVTMYKIATGKPLKFPRASLRRGLAEYCRSAES